MMCEGETEVLFFKHIKSLFPCSINVKNAHGKGASNVVQSAIGLLGYDKKYVLIDADENTLPDALKSAKEHDIQVVLLKQCSEAVFLRILGESFSENCPSVDLKKKLRNKLSDLEPYKKLYGLLQFEKNSLEQCNEQAIKDLISMCNKHKNPNRP